MKIVHLCLACFFPDGYSYQENLLPKFHKRLGYEVEVIASTLTFGPRGEQAYMPHTEPYINENGIRVTRLDYKSEGRLSKKFQLFVGLSEALECSNPDILFIHGCQFLDMREVVKYVKRRPDIKIFVDNHADYTNSATNWISKNILHRVIWKKMAKAIEPYTSKFWGVLPSRVDFLVENYGIPSKKCDLLIMGADDDEVERASSGEVRSVVRQSFGYSGNDFVIVTGGKIDVAKRQTLDLMEAVSCLEPEVKLLIFGPVAAEIKSEFDSRFDPHKMTYIPWASSSESYDLFSAADLVCFPGRHSVYWEQTAAMGKPLLVKDWPGTHHIDCGGNAVFLETASSDEIANILAWLVRNPGDLKKMRKAASIAAFNFLYSEIARKSIMLEDNRL